VDKEFYFHISGRFMVQVHVRPFRIRGKKILKMRIAIIGPQNTGKSTFLQDLLVAFPHYTTSKETYRDVIKQRNLQINRKTSKESQAAIRDFLYKQVSSNKEEHVVFDRSVIDNYVYTKAKHETGEIPSEFLQETEEMLYASLKHLDMLFFIPTTVSVKLEQDGVRDIDVAYLDKINHLFIEILFDVVQKTHFPVYVVFGTRSERVKRVEKFLTTT
jgi:nicotinamide riboside kinase